MIASKDTPQDDGTRERILAAARAEFIEHGLRGARMQQIADRASVNKALLHYHFRDKEGLYQAVLLDIVETVRDRVVAVVHESGETPDPEQTLRRLVHAYVGVLREHPEVVGMMVRELADGAHNLPPLMEALGPLARKLFGGVMGQLAAQPGVPAIEPVHILINLFSMVWGTFLLAPIYSRILPAAGIPLQVDDAFLDARCRAIADTVVFSTLRTGGRS
jgi:TetR/AcrR family transcriptional regulator